MQKADLQVKIYNRKLKFVGVDQKWNNQILKYRAIYNISFFLSNIFSKQNMKSHDEVIKYALNDTIRFMCVCTPC